ncbi:MAG TPA: YkgJ family cysteine cluster protein [Gemmataceae bacterium]|nr:YkgJ family cysteine cluster protein [Gemmataceae bacterium]
MTTDPPAGTRTPLSVVRLDAAGTSPLVTADIRLTIGGEPTHLAISVPEGATRSREFLPVVQGLADVVVGIGIRNVERQGEHISCRKGCGACCRQPVQVSESEALALARLVEAMPEPRRADVRARFADAIRRLDDAGLIDYFRHPNPMPGPEVLSLGMAYFRLGLACPFLEEESCSIHPDRPVACREFLVTTPAEECSRPAADNVRRVPMPARVGRAARAADRQGSGSATGWVPLVLALEWAEAHPEESPSRPGPVLLQEFFARLAEEGAPPGLVADWLPEDGVQPFLTALGWAVGYSLGDGDWEPISVGVGQSDAGADRWYEHALPGRHMARVRLARVPGTGVVRLRVEAPAEVESLVRLALAIFQQFRLRTGTA